VFVGGSTDPFTLLTANMPAHNHMLDTVLTPSGTADAALNRTITGTPSIATHAADMQNTGGGTAHSHGLPALAYVDIIVATKA
jgi:microcystin-dependent protein